jgi:outer membrane protein TolC
LSFAAPHEDGFSLSSALDALATQQGMSVLDVGKRASQVSPGVGEQRALVNAAIADAQQALVAALPRLELSASARELSQLPDQVFGTAVVAPGAGVGPLPPGTPLVNATIAVTLPPSQTLASALLTVPLSEILLEAIPTYQAGLKTQAAQELDLKSARYNASYSARQLAWARIRAQLSREVAERALALARAQAEDVSHAEHVGLSNRADVARARDRTAQAELALAKAQHLLQFLDERLVVALKPEDLAAPALREDLRKPLAAFEREAPVAQLLEQSLSRRPEMQAIRTRIEAANLKASAAHGKAWPKLRGFAEGVTGDPNPRYLVPVSGYQNTWSVGILLTLSPNDMLASSFAASSADAQASALESRAVQLGDAIRVELADALSKVRDSDAAVALSGKSLEAAELDLQARTRLFDVGKATATELLEARTFLTQAEYEVVNARVDQRLARLDLAYAQGELEE